MTAWVRDSFSDEFLLQLLAARQISVHKIIASINLLMHILIGSIK
jgi:hypothetical protein